MNIKTEQLFHLKPILKTQFYDQPWRVFHNWDHIEEGLACFERYFSDTKDGIHFEHQIKLAWMLHDAIYIPGYTGNEVASAALADYYGPLVGMLPNDIAHVKELIMQTKGHKALGASAAPGSDIINDMDLHGMGNKKSYLANAERVKREAFKFYNPTDSEGDYTASFEKQFNMGRFKFLKAYYAIIPNLFKTEIGIEVWQPIAKQCMEQELETGTTCFPERRRHVFKNRS